MKTIIIFLLLVLANTAYCQSPFENSNFFYHSNDTVFLKPYYVAGFSSNLDTSNIAYLNQYNTFTQPNTFSSKLRTDTLRGISGTWGLLSLENGRRVQLENRSTVDSAHIKIFMPGGAIILNNYGGSFFGVSGNPLANDSIMVKVGGNHNFFKYDFAITSNPTGNQKNGIFFNVMEQTDSLIIGGLTGNTPSNSKINLLGRVYVNGSLTTAFDSSLFVKRSAFSQSIEATGDLNILSDSGFVLVSAYGLAENSGIAFQTTGSITLSQSNGLVLDFSGGTGYIQLSSYSHLVAGGVTPATFDGYITIDIGGGNLVDIPYKNNTP